MRVPALWPALGVSILAAGFALGVPAQGPSSKDPIAGYRGWTKVNRDRIYMQPSIAVSCIGPSWWDRGPDNPHTPKYFTVYVNEIGKEAMLAPATSKFPAGSVIVKEKFGNRTVTQPELMTVMIKHPAGYDKPNGDWEYMVVKGDLKSRSESNAKACQSCHNGYASDDYTFRNYVKGHNLPYAFDKPKSAR